MAKPIAGILSLDNNPYLKALATAKQETVKFSKEASAIPAIAGKAMQSTAGIITGSIGAAQKSFASLTAGLGAITSLVPGGSILAEVVTHPFEAAQKAMDRTFDVARDAAQLGLRPEFLRSAQMLAGADAEQAQGAILKLLRLQGELKRNSSDLLQPGRSTAAQTLANYGLDAQGMAKLSGEKFITAIVARGNAMDNASDRIGFALDLASKKGVGLLELFEKGPQALEDSAEKMRRLGLYSEENAKQARIWRSLMKEIKFVQEEFQQAQIKTFGVAGYGLTKIGAGHLSGVNDVAGGLANWVNNAIGGLMPGGKLPDYVPAETKLDNSITSQQRYDFVKKFGMNPEDAKIRAKSIADWKEIAETVGMTAEETALYHAREAHWDEASIGRMKHWMDIAKEKKDLIALTQQRETIANDESFQKVLAESTRMESFESRKHPIRALLDMDQDQLPGKLSELEKQLGLAQEPPRLAGAMEFGSREAFSIDAYARSSFNGGNNENKPILDRLQAIIEAGDRRHRDSMRQGEKIVEALENMGFGVDDN
jgi:hypothetical protein